MKKYLTILIILIIINAVGAIVIFKPGKNNSGKGLADLSSEQRFNSQTLTRPYTFTLGDEKKPNLPKVSFAKAASAIEFSLTAVDENNVTKTIGADQSVQYDNIWPGISLRYVPLGKGLKEEIIVSSQVRLNDYKRYRGKLVFEFTVKPDNALLRKAVIGGIDTYYFIDATTKEYRFKFQPPFMIDRTGSQSNKVSLTLNDPSVLNDTSPRDSYVFSLSPDGDWLAKAIYPVIIDPTATVTDLYDDTTKIDTGNSSGYIITGGQAKINIVSWYQSGGVYWDYRKPVTYDNSGGGAKSNYDVLVVVDTAALVSAGKLQSDCDDLRFTDTDTTTAVNYWIESGCNTASTQIWVRIPDIAASTSETYYMYYGDGAASAGTQSWTGNLVMMFGDTAPGGWSTFTEMTGSFPRGNSSYTGTPAGSDTHNHAVSSTNTEYSNANKNVYKATDTSRTYMTSGRHSFSGDVDNKTVLPPYVETVFATRATFPDSLPSKSILIFTINAASLPANWSSVSAFNDNSRYPYGATSYGATGGSATHRHAYSFTTSTVSHGTTSDLLYAADDAQEAYSTNGGSHSHTLSGNTSYDATDPPYLDVAFGTNSTTQAIPSSSVFIFKTAIPPYGWTRFSDLDSKFPRGATTYGGTSASQHTHTESGTSDTWGGVTYELVRDNTDNAARSIPIYVDTSGHGHTYSFTTGSPSALPPYLDVLFATRNSTAVATTLGDEAAAPDGATIQSINLLSGISSVSSIDSFSYNLSALPANTASTVQFSQNASTWYNASNVSGSTEPMLSGSNTITLTGGGKLNWSGSNFYYKIRFFGPGTDTPILDEISLQYTALTDPISCVLEEGANNDQIIVRWADTNTIEDGYEIDKNTNDSWSSTPYYTTAADATSYTDNTSVSGNNRYQYRVRAKKDTTYSGWCYTTTLNLGVGGFKFEGVKMEGLKVD